jgi:hypothetical protein
MQPDFCPGVLGHSVFPAQFTHRFSPIDGAFGVRFIGVSAAIACPIDSLRVNPYNRAHAPDQIFLPHA